MKLIDDIKKINLARLMGFFSFCNVMYMLIRQQPIEYVNASIYVMAIVWGATFGKNVIDRGVKG